MRVPLRFRGKVVGVLSLVRGDPESSRDGEPDLVFAEEIAQRVAIAVDRRLYDRAQAAIQARDEFLQIAAHELRRLSRPLQLQLEMLARSLEVADAQAGPALLEADEGDGEARGRGAADDAPHAPRRAPRRLADHRRSCRARPRAAGRRGARGGTWSNGSAARRGALAPYLTARGGVLFQGRWDRLRVEQISRASSNAIKYGRGAPIEVDFRERNGSAVISVSDRGIGIDPASLGRIRPLRARGLLPALRGPGLGLFIARQLAEAHHGTIVAESQLGTGSKFTVVLPAAAPPDAPADAAGPTWPTRAAASRAAFIPHACARRR